MKLAGKLMTLFLLAVLVLVPTHTAQAKGLLDGQVIFGSSYTVKSGDTLSGDLVVFGGTVLVEDGGIVRGAVVLMGGSVTIDGEVTKDVVVIGGAATLGETAHVRGSLVTMGAPIQRASGARVDGDMIENATPNIDIPDSPVAPDFPDAPAAPSRPDFGWFTNPLWEMLSLFGRSLSLGLLSMLIVLFLPEQTRRVGEAAAAQPLVTGGLGLLTIFVAPLALLVLIVTLILIPVAGLAIILLGAAMVFGWIGLGTEIGIRMGKMFRSVDIPTPVLAALGTFFMTLVANGIGFIPCVGWLVPFFLSMLGLGAILVTRFGARPVILTATPAPVEFVPPAQEAE